MTAHCDENGHYRQHACDGCGLIRSTGSVLIRRLRPGSPATILSKLPPGWEKSGVKDRCPNCVRKANDQLATA